jgi:predicted transcriptional regulator
MVQSTWRFADYVRKLPIDLRTYTIREAVAKMVENSMSLLVVLSTTKNTPIPIVTLHDVLRLQNQLSDAASL